MKIGYIGKCLLIETGEKIDRGRKKILVIGDLHLGYEESMNLSGIMVSRNMFDDMIKYLDKVFEKIGKVDEVILLGDVKHDFGSILKQEWQDILGLFDYLLKKGKKIVIVKGNHDAILEPVVKKRENVSLEDYYILGNVIFLHGDKDYGQIWQGEIEVAVLGHIHPAIMLREDVKTEKYKCFLDGIYKGKRFIFIPSFSDYSEGSDIRTEGIDIPFKINFNRFDVRVVSEKSLDVLDFGKLGKIK